MENSFDLQVQAQPPGDPVPQTQTELPPHGIIGKLRVPLAPPTPELPELPAECQQMTGPARLCLVLPFEKNSRTIELEEITDEARLRQLLAPHLRMANYHHVPKERSKHAAGKKFIILAVAEDCDSSCRVNETYNSIGQLAAVIRCSYPAINTAMNRWGRLNEITVKGVTFQDYEGWAAQFKTD